MRTERTVAAIAAAEGVLLGGVPRAADRDRIADVTRREAEGLAAACGLWSGERLTAEAIPDLFAGSWLDDRWTPEILADKLDTLSARHGAPRVAVAIRALRDPGLLGLTTPVALYLELALLVAATRAPRAAVYARAGVAGEPVAEVGTPGSAGREGEARLAAAVLSGDPRPGAADQTVVRVERWGYVLAVLIVESASPETRLCAEIAAGTLRTIFDREALLTRISADQSAVGAAADWRVARLEAELHAGPLRELQDLRDELRVCRRQIARTRLRRMPAAVFNGRLGDIEARVGAFDDELRSFCRMLTAPLEDSRSIAALLHDLGSLAGERWGLKVDVQVAGDADALTHPQRVAILRITEEALDNAREHGGARHVGVVLHVQRTHLDLSITDNGRGFDVSAALATHDGYGLPGIVERVRLLGGACSISSWPGAPTTISVGLPLWTSLAELPPAVTAAEPVLDAATAAELELDPVATDGPARLAVAELAGGLIARLWPERTWADDDLGRRVATLADATGVPPAAVALRALREPELLTLPPIATMDLALVLLTAVAGAGRATLWVEVDDDVRPLLSRGAAVPRSHEHTRTAALLRAGEDPGGRATVAVPVLRWMERQAVLVLDDIEDGVGGALAAAAAALLGAVLDREALLRRGAEAERRAVEPAERRLARHGFDLHDGPLQDVAAFGQRLRRLREDVALGIRHDRLPCDYNDQLDELQARLRGVDEQLHAFVASLSAPQVLGRPLPELLQELVESLSGRAVLQVSVDVRGDVERASNSQRIALLRIIQEALGNAQKHSRATHVRIGLRATETQIIGTVSDDGVGFDVGTTVIGSAARGRRGLVSMVERARMLGGSCRIDSAPGASTTVTISMPIYVPADDRQERPSVRAARH